MYVGMVSMIENLKEYKLPIQISKRQLFIFLNLNLMH
jgi:hypothetical protein